MLRIQRTNSSGLRFERGPFETLHSEQGRELTITLLPTSARLRLKGQRRALDLTYEAMWTRASEFAVRELRAKKKAARAARRKGKPPS